MLTLLTFTQWNPTIPITIVARYGGSPDSLISTEAVKPYRASVSEISIHLPAMPWIRGFNTRCFRGQYRSPMLERFSLDCRIGIGFGFGFGLTTSFGWLVYLLWFWFYDSQVKTALYTFKFLCCEHHRDREKLRKFL